MAIAAKQATLTVESALSADEERVARGVVVAHRARLEWLLRVPEWEPLLEEGMAVLDLPGQRQGIGLDAAVRALPLESKHELVRWVMVGFRRRLSAGVARGICKVCDLERLREQELDEALSDRQWRRLRDEALFRLAKEHRRYKHAQQLLFVGYRHLVDRVVGRTAFRSEHRADCEQEGAMGLLQAIDRVDESSRSLGAYAVAWIRRTVRNYLMRTRLPVYAPVNLISRASMESGSAGGDMGLEGGNDGVDRRVRALLLECLQHPVVSLDAPARPGGGTVSDEVADEAAETPEVVAEREDLRTLVRRRLDVLTDKQREVLELRYGLGGGGCASLTDIARSVGISHQQVSMREQRAMRRMESALVQLSEELR